MVCAGFCQGVSNIEVVKKGNAGLPNLHFKEALTLHPSLVNQGQGNAILANNAIELRWVFNKCRVFSTIF